MVIDRQQLRAMSALRMVPPPVPRTAKPYSLDVARVAQFLLHKCKEHIAVGIGVPQSHLTPIMWDDVFSFAIEDIYGFSESDYSLPVIHLIDGRTLDVCGLLNDFMECAHYRAC